MACSVHVYVACTGVGRLYREQGMYMYHRQDIMKYEYGGDQCTTVCKLQDFSRLDIRKVLLFI